MKAEKYHLKAESGFTRFEFVSEGKKGTVRKLIEFQKTNNPDVFNLAFGDFNEKTQDFDDLAITDNGDTDKVLITVVQAVFIFYTKYPNVFVFACGSTEARTRLYRMGITRYYEEMKKDFYLYGQIGDNFVEFEIGKEYEGFLVQKKLL
jgi:hypothetical protein